MSYTKVAKPGAQTYTTISKPNNGFVINAGISTGLLIPPTRATAYTFGNLWNDISKPSNGLDQQQNSVVGNESFGGTTTTAEKVAQSFKPTITANLLNFQIPLAIFAGTLTDSIQAQLYDNNAGVPGNLIIAANNTILGSSLTRFLDASSLILYYNFYFNSSLTANTTYWIVVSRTGSLNNTNTYRIFMDNDSNNYTRGKSLNYYSGSWNDDGFGSITFKEFIAPYTNISKPT